MITVVDMIPSSLSGNQGQDSEPNIAVNPAQPTDMVATAFTAAPLGGAFAPIYVSNDGGLTWSIRTVVPGNGSFGTGDITVGFSTDGGVLYAGTLNGTNGRMQIMRTASFLSTTPMTVLVDRPSEDQPWVVVGSIVVSNRRRDRVFVGNNDFSQPGGGTATVDVSQDAAKKKRPAGFSPIQLERRVTAGQDGPPIRLALHQDGTVYAAHHRWTATQGTNVTMDIVVTRDDAWCAGANPFTALVDPVDGGVGVRVAMDRFVRWNDTMGQERLGGDLSVAVDPNDPATVWVAWCDRVGGLAGSDWTLHVRQSRDRGQTWSADLRTITNAKNPALAVNGNGHLGLAYQQFVAARWTTALEVTTDAFGTAPTVEVLHTAPANTPARTFLPYLGDYIRLLAVGNDFYGVFSGNNTPDLANFPNGVTYQRNADWATHTLLDLDGVSVVPVSVDPFFFHYS